MPTSKGVFWFELQPSRNVFARTIGALPTPHRPEKWYRAKIVEMRGTMFSHVNRFVSILPSMRLFTSAKSLSTLFSGPTITHAKLNF